MQYENRPSPQKRPVRKPFFTKDMGLFLLARRPSSRVLPDVSQRCGRITGVSPPALSTPALHVSRKKRLPVTAILSRLSGVMTICALPKADMSELSAFLDASGFHILEGEASLLEKLDLFPAVSMYSSFALQCCKSPENQCFPGFCIEAAPSLSEVFHLLCRADNAFEAQANYGAWLTEFSHKRRHGLGETYVLSVENRIVSTISILFKDPRRVLLGMAATEPGKRRRGYAGALTSYVAAQCRQRGYEVWTLAAEDGLCAFYERYGFQKCARWGRFTRKTGKKEGNSSSIL